MQDWNMQATGPFSFNYAWPADGIYATAISTNIGLFDNTPGPGSETDSVYNTDLFALTNLNYATSGDAQYAATVTGLLTTSGTLNLAYTGTVTNGTTGAIIVTNGIAWMEMNFSLSDTLNVEGGLILAMYSIAGTTVASGPVAGTTSRALVWGNSAGTRNWNTNDVNWNVGTAIWNNFAPDGAIFTDMGIGTVSLVQPIAANWLWFNQPGYQVTDGGGSLALTGVSAITNDADAVISGVIGSGALNKWGSSTLTLSGANTYTGATTVGAGILKYDNAASPGATSQITVQSGAEVYFDSAFLGATVEQPDSAQWSGRWMAARCAPSCPAARSRLRARLPCRPTARSSGKPRLPRR